MNSHDAIVAVGSLAFDSIQTPSGCVDSTLGGSVNHFSIAASFYAPVKAVAVVGSDFPSDHLDWLARRRIDVSGVQRLEGKTFHWSGLYQNNLNEVQTLSTSLNVLEHFHPKLTQEACQSSYVFLGNLDPLVQLEVLKQVENPRWVGCDSMNFWITGKPEALKETLRHVDLLSLNETEAFLISKKSHILSAAREIHAMGPSVVVIKRGEYGAMLFVEGDIFVASSYPIEHAVDPTGAGDSFAGAMMGYLASVGMDRSMNQHDRKQCFSFLKQSIIAGCVMASFTIEDFGCQRLMRLGSTELVDRREQFVRMLSI
jgi:sugar/nucleoside kinase (ribokinase family)